MRDYSAITRVLLEDPSSELHLIYHNMDSGVKHIRRGIVEEPHPHAGKRAYDMCSGFTTTVSATRPKVVHKSSLKFDAQNTLEVLDLLDRAADGEKRVQNTVKSGRHLGEKEGYVHGHEDPQGGIDNWVRGDFRVAVKRSEGKELVARLSTCNFHSRNILVATSKGMTVGQAIAPFEDYPQETQTIEHIRRGDELQAGIGRAEVNRPKYNLDERAKAIFGANHCFINNYGKVLARLAPLNITQQAKNALFVSMLIQDLYESKEEQEPVPVSAP
jgi:hypothetical protein